MAKRFAVALSFPGEHRPFVEGMAGSLAATLTRPQVFYDRYYEAELARPNLDIYLQDIYHNDAELIVVVVCKEYDEKEWTGLEARAIRDLIKTRNDDEIMFVRVGDGDVAGLFGIDGYVDARNRPPVEIAQVVCDRLQLVRARAKLQVEIVSSTTVVPGNGAQIVPPDEIEVPLRDMTVNADQCEDGKTVKGPEVSTTTADSRTGADAKRTLQVIVAIGNEAVRNSLVALIHKSHESGDLCAAMPDLAVSIVVSSGSTLHQHQHDVFSRLESCFTRENSAAILLSDFLAERIGDFPEETWEPTSLAKECQVRFRERMFGTVSILPYPQRVLDIDRTIGENADSDELLKAFELVACRISYLAKPTRTAKFSERNIIVRAIKTNQTEFVKYFELRHRVYRPMSYLSPDVEDCLSQMEMDWCDKKSIHCGAFVRVGGQEKLVGTARLITDMTVTNDNQRLFHELAGDDYILHGELNRALTLGLPVFESQRGTNRLISDILLNRESCGELSRVIVVPEFRGVGLSEKLVKFAITRARNAKLGRLFLECLEIHQHLYEKMGFVCVPELRGKVVGVDRTMIVMQLPSEVLSPNAVETTARKV